MKSELIRLSNCLVLRNGKFIRDDLWIRDGKVVDPEKIFYIEQIKADKTIDCKNNLVSPGLIDIQVNGGWGVDFSFDTESTESGIQKVAKGLLTQGVTSFCPTMVTSDKDKYHQILPHIKRTPGGKHGATVLGIHLEGPFINPSKKGAHVDRYIKTPDQGFQSILEVYGHLENVSYVTLAPELNGALDAIKGLTSKGIGVALGHTTSTLAQAEEAVVCGAKLITHLFNAMPSFHHRDPGLVGLLTSNTDKQVYYGIISDGFHTHPAALKIAYRTNSQGLILVSDAVAPQGLVDGEYRIGPQSVTVENARAYVSGTKVLCGSTAALDVCVRYFKENTGCSLEYALEAASLHPARALGIDKCKGSLEFGCDGDFIVLNPNTLDVLQTWIAGECVYNK